MPFCPECRYEYEDGVSECPDCGTKLVSELPESDADQIAGSDTRDEDWVEIARLTSQQYAEMVVEGLQQQRIPAVSLSHAGHFGVIGTMGTSVSLPVGGAFYSIMVPRDRIRDADRAGDMLLGDVWRKSRVVGSSH